METTFLKEEEIWGDEALEAMKAYGTKVAPTDLAVLLGAFVTGEDERTSEGDLTCLAWSASADYYKDARVVYSYGGEYDYKPTVRRVAARPALPSSETSRIRPHNVRTVKLSNGKTVKVAEWGEYPQAVTSLSMHKTLDKELSIGRLKKTGKKYTFDSEDLTAYNKKFNQRDCPEFEFGGKRYIHLLAKKADDDSVLSTGETVEDGKAYWVEVQPIEWLVDPTGVWWTKKAMFAGVQFDTEENYDGNFNKTFMKKFLDTYFSKDIQPTRDYSAERAAAEKAYAAASKPRRNSYGIQVIDAPMSIKEQIDFYVQNGMSFMLHGPSGVGKTARVEAVDPDLTAVPLWNGVLPEDIVGKVRYPNGVVTLPPEFAGEEASGNASEETVALSNKAAAESGIWVAPDWYTELCRKCAAEPNKQHVLFIDEVTNARPTTQSLVFHIVLKKSISPSKGKLPPNAVVVLAGNSKEESGAAYNMPEPLFRRMVGHIHLSADVTEWLEWGSEKSRKHPEDPDRLNIHPLISSFVATYGQQAFYSSYDEEKPREWAMDPRGWEQVSDIIYDNKGIIRRELLESKMGKEMAANLLSYAQNPPLSLNEIIEGEYDKNDIPAERDAQLALTLSLRHVNERQVDKVRQFISKHLGAENKAIFDSVWVGKNDERALQIASLQLRTQKGSR